MSQGGSVALWEGQSSGRGGRDEGGLHPTPMPPTPPGGPHRVKGWETEAGHRPLEKELLRCSKRQAKVEGKLGVRAEVREG